MKLLKLSPQLLKNIKNSIHYEKLTTGTFIRVYQSLKSIAEFFFHRQVLQKK